MIRYVAGFLFNDNNSRVALIRKNKPEFLAGKLNAIGGKIEDNEAVHDAMVREFKEETGVDIPWELWKYKLQLIHKDWVVYFFKANSNLVEEIRTMEKEEVFVYDVGSLYANRHNMVGNLSWILPLMLDNSVKFSTVEEV